MRSQLFSYLVFIFIAVMAVSTPQAVKADVVDDLLVQVQSMMEQMAKVQQQLLELQKGSSATVATTPEPAQTGTVLGAATFKFADLLTRGATNDSVKKMQELLKQDSEIYPEGITSGFFGPATTAAVRQLQTRFGLDPVGVVGPATTALLQRLIAQQNSDGSYPADILDPTRPTGDVLGATTSTTGTIDVQTLLAQIAALQTKQKSQTSSTGSTNTSDIDAIEVEIDDGESLVTVEYKNGSDVDFWVDEDEEEDIIEAIAEKLKISESVVEDLVDFGKKKRSSSNSTDDIDEIRADVDVEDGEAEVTVVFEDEDENDKEFTVDESEYEDIIQAIAEELDIDEDDVRDLIEFDWNVRARDIDEINVTVEDGEASVEVVLESGDEFEFILDEDDEDDIIEAIADMLDIDEDEVEDLLDIDFKDEDSDGLDYIEVEVEDGRATVYVKFNDGSSERFSMDEDDEDEMIETIADRIGETDNDVEDVIEFDYN